MNKLKLYCGQDEQGVWKASRHLEALKGFTNIFSSDIDEVKLQDNTVYMAVAYYGYGTIYDMLFDIVLYTSIDEARQEAEWKKLYEKAKALPNKYRVTPISISSINKGKAFEVGDTTKNGFQWRVIDVNLI